MNTIPLTPDSQIWLSMVDIPAGTFLMGSPVDEPGRFDDEGPQHMVQLQGFQMSQTPITQAQWAAVMGTNPSRFCGEQRPVEMVSWHDAMEFCQRLNQRTGETFALPSEAQWEHACRAGTTTPFAFGDKLTKEQANFDTRQTTDVGMFHANAWGLHDMHGNVWEWCMDDWHDSYAGAPGDGSAWVEGESLGKSCAAAPGSPIPGTAARPTAPAPSPTLPASTLGSVWSADPDFRLLRGGSWFTDPRFCRSACRFRLRPDDAIYGVGFRVACLPPPRPHPLSY